jgi:tetratricopeptide (TPR) repeat protein
MNGSEHAEEHFLREVESLVAIPEEVDRELNNHPLVLANELGARRFVLRGTTLHQRRFPNTQFRPARDPGLLHKEISSNLPHYRQVRHCLGRKVPIPWLDMRRALLATLLVVLAILGAVTYEAVARDRDYQALLVRGDRALADDQTFGAIEAYSGAVALRPDSMLARLRRGEAYQRRGDLEAAVRDYRAAADLDTTAIRPREELGDALYQLQQYPGAAQAYDNALKIDDRLTRVTSKLSLARYRGGDATAAIALLTRTAPADMTAESYYLLALCLRDAHRTEDAQHALEKAIVLSPALIPAREELVDVYAAENRRADELDQLQALASLDREHADRQLSVAMAQARSGHTERAVITLGAALDRAPGDPAIYEALGRVWFQDAEARDDRQALNKALEALGRAGVDPRATSETLTLYGRALLRNGQIDLAEQVLQQATTRFPVDSASFAHYATAAERLNHLDAARQALVDFDALVGAGVNDAQFVSRAMRIAALSNRLNDPASAARWLQKAADASPMETKLLAALADAQFKAGDPDAARGTIARGLHIDPENAALLRLSRRQK